MPDVSRIHIATGLALESIDGRTSVLLVASHYANHAVPLWTLPGGRQHPGELLEETVAREILEETGLHAHAGELAYLSESYDGPTHVLNATFRVSIRGSHALGRAGAEDHVAGAAWVPIEQLESRLRVAVVREPLLAHLRGDLVRRYAGYHEAGITIRWPSSHRRRARE